MLHNRYSAIINRIPNKQDFSTRKKNYLTESSCEEIQKELRKDYFNRLQKVSLNNLINYVNEDEVPKHRNINIDDFQKPLNYAARQILFSDKIRKINYNWIKKHPNRKSSNEMETVQIPDYNSLIKENNVKKNTMFKANRIYKDKYPVFYDLNYIDEVENKYIKPYLSKDTIVYKDYIQNKKSKMPFNFIIG